MEAKKSPKADLNKKSSLFLAIGLLASLSITFAAFEWKHYDKGIIMDLGMITDDFDDLIEIPPTEQLPPKAPPIQQPIVIPIPDDEDIDPDIDIVIDVEVLEKTEIADLVFEDQPDEIVSDEPFLIVEDPAEFPGNGWNKFLNENLKYPRQAQRMGIEGSVDLSFVVAADGSLSDIEVTRGIGGGCDEEAIRVLKSSPKWIPGKQRGVAVKSRMAIRVKFRLN
ncbi:energy transducer TonB [Roseivirga echinicomitans]